MSHSLLGPLETVDPYEPLGPLHDRESSALKAVQQFQEAQEDQQVHEMSTVSEEPGLFFIFEKRLQGEGEGRTLDSLL
jgi:hypothetical protein